MIVLWLAGILAGVLLVVLVTPVRIDIDLALPPPDAARSAARVRVQWAFMSWSSGGRSRAPATPAPTVAEEPPSTRKALGTRPRAFLAMLRTPGFPRRCWQALIGTGRALVPEHAVVSARVGFDDPATTGMFMGALASLRAIPRRDHWHVTISPEFAEPIVAGRAQLRWSIPPGRVLWPIARLLCAPVTWRAARAGWAARRTPGNHSPRPSQ